MANTSAFPIYCEPDYNNNRNTGDPQTQIPGKAFQEDVLGTSYEDTDPSTGLVCRKFVLMDTASAVVTDGVVPAGNLCYYLDSDETIVTNDIDGTLEGTPGAGINRIAGVLEYDRTPGNKGWVVTWGTLPVLANEGTFVAGEQVVPDSGDGLVAPVVVGAAPVYPVVGIAQGASAGSPLKVSVSVKIAKA